MATKTNHPPGPDGHDDRLAPVRIAEELEDRILRKELTDGQMLPSERALIEEFGISRTVAREAIKLLGGKGLIDIRPRHRPVVRLPRYEHAFGMLGSVARHLVGRRRGVRQLFELRIFIEAGLVREAATSAGKEDLRHLQVALADNEASIDDSEQFYATDTAFHAALYKIPKNPIFPAVHQAFHDWLAQHWVKMPRNPERNRQNFGAHSAIFEAILMRDPDAAEHELRQHLNNAWDQVREVLEEVD